MRRFFVGVRGSESGEAFRRFRPPGPVSGPGAAEDQSGAREPPRVDPRRGPGFDFERICPCPPLLTDCLGSHPVQAPWPPPRRGTADRGRGPRPARRGDCVDDPALAILLLPSLQRNSAEQKVEGHCRHGQGSTKTLFWQSRGSFSFSLRFRFVFVLGPTICQ